MSEPLDDVEESQSDSEEAESEEIEVNCDLFKDQNGFRIAFHLHESIKKSFSRRNLTRDIERHGGIVLDTDIGCDTVLVDVMYDKKETLQTTYNTDDDPRLRRVFVEWTSFVQHCIRYNHFVHRIPALKGMGGTVGNTRVPFTERDEECLCHYLARILPDKAAGGRLGLEVYKELVRTAAVRSTHAWGARHTAESWKERYKKNMVKFDEWIEDIVKLEGRSRKQLWHADRRANQKYLRGKHKYEHEDRPSEDSPSEDDYGPQPSQNRRADYSLPPLNRRRVVRRESDRKGKSRADEEEEEDEEDEPVQFEDHVDQDEIIEPGPSRSQRQRSLEATAVAADDLSHRTQPNSASFFTQNTIVASGPSGRSVQSKEVSHLLDEAAQSSSLVRQSIRVTRGTKEPSPSAHEPLATIDPTSPSGSIQSIRVNRRVKQVSPSGSLGRNSPVIQLSPTRTLVNPPQRQEAQPPTHERPRKAARRPRAMIEAAAADAPYRNTRSRSQSVEPSTYNSPVRGSKTRKLKAKQETMPALATVDETQDDGRQGSENLEVMHESVSPGVEGLFTDENDVEKMLISDEDEELDYVDEVRGESLDTDDAQTEQNLRSTQPPHLAFSSLRRHPSEILKEFQEHSILVARPHLSNRLAVPVRHTQEDPGGIPFLSLSHQVPVKYKAAEPPRTPLKRPRNHSASSMDLFPVSGTRASAFKNELQQEEKRSPYKPLSGTRAAKLARSGK